MTNESEGSTSGAASTRGALARHAHPQAQVLTPKTGRKWGVLIGGTTGKRRDTEEAAVRVATVSSIPGRIQPCCVPGDSTSKPESKEFILIITCIDLCALEEDLLVPEQPSMNGY